jgi:HEPN domain-containing protein
MASAENDLLAAQALLEVQLPSYETASFHAQQASEKALKALLIRHQVDFMKTHDLGDLLLLADRVAPGLSRTLAAAAELTRHAVDSRYPSLGDDVSREEATHHVRIASNVLVSVREHLRDYVDSGRPGG